MHIPRMQRKGSSHRIVSMFELSPYATCAFSVVPREARTCTGRNLARAVRDDATTQPATSHQSSTPHASITKQAMTPVSEPSDRMLFGSTADSSDPCGMITGSNGKCKSGSGTGFVPGRQGWSMMYLEGARDGIDTLLCAVCLLLSFSSGDC